MNGFGFNSNGFVRQFLDRPIATYTHTTNKEVVVSAVDVDTDTFTSAGHGLVNNDVIFAVLNSTNMMDYPLKYFPTGLTGVKLYVVNKTDDTFQVSTNSGGSAVNLTTNPTQDLTKWHFEKIAEILAITNLPSLQACRVVITGRTANTSYYVLPYTTNVSDYYTASYLSSDENSIERYPAVSLGGGVYVVAEFIINTKNYLLVKANGMKIHYSSNSANAVAETDVIFVNPAVTNLSFTKIAIGSSYVLNGTMVEVYKA